MGKINKKKQCEEDTNPFLKLLLIRCGRRKINMGWQEQ